MNPTNRTTGVPPPPATQASEASRASPACQASDASRASPASQASEASRASPASQASEASRASPASQASDVSHPSHPSHSSHSPHPSHPIIPPRGDYRTLLSFQKAEVVYDITFRFVHAFLERGDRTVDQMLQSARSGKKNICEGSKAGRTSKEMELKLTGVARASLEELLDDYLDFLRVRDLPIWDKDSREAVCVRDLGRTEPQTYELYREFVETRPPAVVANIAVCLIHQANYLIDQQLARLEQDFVRAGGLRERMTRARLDHRERGADGCDQGRRMAATPDRLGGLREPAAPNAPPAAQPPSRASG
jgi:four helix bundle suffix protein